MNNYSKKSLKIIAPFFFTFLLYPGIISAESLPDDVKNPGTVIYHGIDASHFQGNINWDEVKKDKISFAYVKSTEGSFEIDPKFFKNWNEIKEAGITRGAYHFFRPGIDARSQAEHYIKTVKLEPGDLPPVLDIEVTDAVRKAGIDKDIRIWLETVSNAFKITPIIYSDRSFIEKYLPSGFSRYPLWLAEYSQTPPKAPADWKNWVFWQYSQTGRIRGVGGHVDKDLYVGTDSLWKQLLIPAKTKAPTIK